jgi:hypothetical protein
MNSLRITVIFVIAQAWYLYTYLKEQRACLLKDNETVGFSKWPTAWEII